MTCPHLALPCPIAPYVPHTQGMCLLDRLLAINDDSLIADVTPARDDLFATAQGIPGWVGLEWLAQGVAAWAGWQAATLDASPAVGFLLGTRRFETFAAHFATGETFHVTVHREFRADNGLGHFHGTITRQDGTRLAEGSLTVFQSDTRHEIPSP